MAEIFIPRTTDAGMQGNPWWYSSGNIFYPNFGLPNCTCYAYGRWGEIRNEFANLPGGDAGTWYNSVTGFEKGQTPKLGAIACYHDPNGVRPGHVSVVEAIENGNISTSNSGWNGPYFWYAENLTPASGYRESWIISYGYVLQGFIYIDKDFGPGPTPINAKKMPLWMMLKHLH